jgi:hypothetical protein
VTGDGSRRGAAGTAVRHASRPHPRSPLTAQPERLADLVRALQQLPPEVWERVETAGPPVVVHLEVGEAAPLSPLSIDPLAGAELSPADSAASDVSPGGYR